MTIPVGFSASAASPAATGTVTAGQNAAGKAGEAGLPSLFAMLMALIGGKPAEALAEGQAAVAGLLDQGQQATAPLVFDMPAGDSADTDTLLADLGELGGLLADLTTALQSGTPVPDDLATELDETLDAVATVLGLPAAPPAPLVPTPTVASDTLLPGIDAEPALPSGDSDADGLPRPLPQLDAPQSPEQAARPLPPDGEPHLLKLADEFARRLEGQSPELAQKLKQVLTGLAQADVPTEHLRQLGSEAVARLTAIPMALQPERPIQGAATPTAPDFTAPSLDAPDGLTAPDLAETAKPDRPPDRPAAAADRTRDIRIESADGKPTGQPTPAGAPTDPTAASQPLTPTTAPATAAGARVVHAAYQAPVQQLNLPAIAFDIARHVEGGNSRFQIRLDPPELGRIDVRMDVDQGGAVHARLTVERSETLDLLQRDQRALQQALQQAGLDGNKTNLEFSLRQNPFGGDTGQGQGQGNPFGGGPLAPTTPESDTPDLSTVSLYRGTAQADGVNLFV